MAIMNKQKLSQRGSKSMTFMSVPVQNLSFSLPHAGSNNGNNSSSNKLPALFSSNLNHLTEGDDAGAMQARDSLEGKLMV